MYEAKQSLLKKLSQVQLPEEARIVPTSFDPADPEMAGFLAPADLSWKSLTYALLRGGARKGILLRLPLFWQVESLVYAAGKAAGVPLFVNEQENMPVGGAALKAEEVDVVLTDAEDAISFSRFLAEKEIADDALWFIIHSSEAPAWSLPFQQGRVVQEVHLFPGLPILFQCEAQWGTNSFHQVEEFTWEYSCLTTPASYPVPLVRYAPPFTFQERGPCRCGKLAVERT